MHNMSFVLINFLFKFFMISDNERLSPPSGRIIELHILLRLRIIQIHFIHSFAS